MIFHHFYFVRKCTSLIVEKPQIEFPVFRAFPSFFRGWLRPWGARATPLKGKTEVVCGAPGPPGKLGRCLILQTRPVPILARGWEERGRRNVEGWDGGRLEGWNGGWMEGTVGNSCRFARRGFLPSSPSSLSLSLSHSFWLLSGHSAPDLVCKTREKSRVCLSSKDA